MDKVRIGFVGVGFMGQRAHLSNYVTVPECEVVALAELREGLGRKVAARYGVPGVYRDYEEMLAKEKLDAIVASQPFTRHGVLLPGLFKARLPVFTEKPLAGCIEVGERIVAALADSGTWHMVGYHKRSDPATMYAKAEIDRLRETGELGALRYVRVLMPAGDWVAGGDVGYLDSEDESPELEWDPPASDMDSETYDDYGSFVNYYIHQVNLLRHLLGEPYRVVFADPSGVLLAAQSERGVAGAIEMTPYETSMDWQESALVAFQRGYVKLDLPAPLASNRPGQVEILRDGERRPPMVEVPHLPWIGAMRQQAMNFVAAVKGDMKPMCDAAEALEDLKMARDYIQLMKGR